MVQAILGWGAAHISFENLGIIIAVFKSDLFCNLIKFDEFISQKRKRGPNSVLVDIINQSNDHGFLKSDTEISGGQEKLLSDTVQG